MNNAQTPMPLKPWPPLITATRLSVWVTIRDVLGTFSAWLLLAWLLKDPIYVAYDFLRHPIFELTRAQPLDVGVLWWRLRYFWIASVG